MNTNKFVAESTKPSEKSLKFVEVKSPIVKTMGFARRNRGGGPLNWRLFWRVCPKYRDHIYRIRKNQKKLVQLVLRLKKEGKLDAHTA